uniref:Uncharacterized protein n=1 Tax=Eutreptiella gymnastica TaxID=73025 RepID=A0A7S4LP73_9EUGL
MPQAVERWGLYFPYHFSASRVGVQLCAADLSVTGHSSSEQLLQCTKSKKQEYSFPIGRCISSGTEDKDVAQSTMHCHKPNLCNLFTRAAVQFPILCCVLRAAVCIGTVSQRECERLSRRHFPIHHRQI